MHSDGGVVELSDAEWFQARKSGRKVDGEL